MILTPLPYKNTSLFYHNQLKTSTPMTDFSKTQVNWDNFKCRCSGIHKIMANGKGKSALSEKQLEELKLLKMKLDLGKTFTENQKQRFAELTLREDSPAKYPFGDTCIEYLGEVYALQKYGMVPVGKEVELEQLQKGRLAEADSISLLSFVDDAFYSKNEERIENDFLIGEPDIFNGEEIMTSDKIIDVKNSFDMPGFIKKINAPILGANKLQVQGYMDITGAKNGEIAHVLVSMPLIMQIEMRKRLFFKGDYATEENAEFKMRWEILERSMNFDHVPPRERVFKIKVEPFTKEEQTKLYDKVKMCRDWLYEFDEMHSNMNKNLDGTVPHRTLDEKIV